MDLACPCCVCVEGAKLNIPLWFSETISAHVLQGSPSKRGSFTYHCDEENRKEVRYTNSGNRDDCNAKSKFASSTSRLSMRLAMDGSIHAVQPSFQPRILNRTASIDSHDILAEKYGYSDHLQDCCDHELKEENQRPQSLSRIDSLPSKPNQQRPRMRRRCSVTKFNLEESFQQVQLEDHMDYEQDQGQKDVPSPPPQADELPRRPRLQRRCSVTKFNLEDTLDRVQKGENGTVTSTEPRPESPETILRKETDDASSQALIATPEPKRRFKARLPWGRAA